MREFQEIDLSRGVVTMAGEGSSRLLQNTERSTGSAVLQDNIEAVIELAKSVQSTLGPHGLDKMLVDDQGRILVTNDGVTIINTGKVEHPAAKMVISSSIIQDEVARDGTTSTILLASELLINAWELVIQGIHPSQIAAGYRLASDACASALGEIARGMSGDSELLAATLTSLAGKGQAAMQSRLAELAVQAAKSIAVEDDEGVRADPTLVKIIANRGGVSTDSSLVNGLVLAKSCIHPEMIDWPDGGKILLIDGGLERRSPSIDATIKVTSAGMLDAFRAKDREILRQQVDAVISLSPQVVAVRDGVDDEARQWLADAGITTYRRVEKQDLELLARATGAKMIHRPENVPEESLGEFSTSMESLWGETTHWTLEGSVDNGVTLIVCGTTEEMIAEAERCFDDAIGVACQLLEEPLLLPGGGATYIALARRLRRFAEGIPGREQLAVEGFADALEVIPRTLAENSGMDPIDTVLQLVSEQTTKGDWIGLDANLKSPKDVDESEIREPLRITRQVINGSTDSAISLLRIDDKLWSMSDPQMPELPPDED